MPNLMQSLGEIKPRWKKLSPEELKKYEEDTSLINNKANWDEARRWVDSKEELPVEKALEVEPIIAGKHGKSDHLLNTYIYEYPPKYPYISMVYSWARCNKCDQTRWNKKSIYFKGNPAICYDKYTQKIQEG